MNADKTILVVGLMGSLLCGCNTHPAGEHEPFFTAGTTDLDRIFEVQASRGARNDATLYPQHFSHNQLNSLGREKLALMLKDNDTAFPLAVYLDAPDGTRAARSQAIKSYLIDAGLADSQFKIEPGPNPSTLHPIAPDLHKLQQLDQPDSQNPATPPTPLPDMTPKKTS